MINKKSLKSIFQIAGSIVGLILIFYQIKNGISAVNQNLVEFFNYKFILFSLLFSIIALFFQILGWFKINNSLENKLTFRNILFGYVFTFLPRYIPGSIWGYLTRSEWLANSHNISYKNSLYVSVLEMVIILISNLALGSIFFYYSSSQILFLFLPIFIILFSIVTIKYFTNWSLFKNILPNHFIDNIDFGTWIIIFSSFITSWVFYGIGLAFSLNAFTNVFIIDISFLLLSISINSISWIIGFLIIFVPAGLGIREILLNHLLISSLFISANIASIVAVVYRIITLAAEIILLLLGYFIRKK